MPPVPLRSALLLALLLALLPLPTLAAGPTTRPLHLFSPTSVWNRPLPAGVPLDPHAPEILADFLRTVRRESRAGTGPWIATTQYSTPLYIVPRSQPTTRVSLPDPSAAWRRSLQAAFDAVPLPPDAHPANGTDGHLTLYQPDADTLWEFWQLKKDPAGQWHASWGGAMQHVSTSPGYYTTDSWPGAQPHWGATATSLPVIAGTVLISELRAGKIPHALAIDIGYPRYQVYASPAQRTDGTDDSPLALPEGAHLRIDPSLDLARIPMTPVCRMLAEAAQTYGMIVRDKTDHATSFYFEDPTPTGPNPYAGPTGLFQGKWPHDVLKNFPWDHLQLLKMNLHTQPHK